MDNSNKVGKSHTLDLAKGHLHGQFSKDLVPAITVESGDRLTLKTLDVTWGMEQHGGPGTSRKRFEPRVYPKDDGPALTGPVGIRNARPGQTLEIRIEKIVTGDWGWTFAGPSHFNRDLLSRWNIHDEALIRWSIDSETGTATSEDHIQIPIRPFPGTIGMPDNKPGWQSGWQPRVTGGNMDCKYLTEGSTLYLPIRVENGLLSLGDGHAAQDNGELGGSAIECMMEEVQIQLILRDDLTINQPRIQLHDKWITLGFHKNLDRAIDQAVNEMIELVQNILHVSRSRALAYASSVVGLEITQLVNGTRGVQAVFDQTGIQQP